MTNLRGTFTGCWFESRIHDSLMFTFGDEIRILRNKKIFSYKLNRITEIDLLIITPFGLYSVEAKSFKTSLEGSINSSLWIGRTGKYTTRVFSPFIQNNEHIRSLKNCLRRNGFEPPMITNMVCVPDICKIKTDCPTVYNLSSLVYKIEMDGIYKKHQYDVEQLYNILKGLEV